MSMLSNLDLLRRVPLFALMPPSQAQRIASVVTKRRLKRGDPVVAQGERSQALFIILAGRVRVLSTDAQGREVILARLGPGDHLGEMSLIDGEPHSATCRAEVQTDVLVLSRRDFETCLPEPQSIAHAIMRALVRRLRDADRKIESLALLDVYGRVARALLDLAAPQQDGELRIRDKVSRQDVAKMVGASREMVSRVMRDLERRGMLRPHPEGGLIVQPGPGAMPRSGARPAVSLAARPL